MENCSSCSHLPFLDGDLRSQHKDVDLRDVDVDVDTDEATLTTPNRNVERLTDD